MRSQLNGEWKGLGRHMAQGVLSMFLSFIDKLIEMRINYTEGHNLQRSKGQISVKGSGKTTHLVDLRKKVSNLFPKVDFVLYFVLVCLFASLIFTLLAFLLFKVFFPPNLLAPLY